jgi:hypothetical protein
MAFRYSRNSFETLRSDSLFIVGYQGYSSFINCFRRTVTVLTNRFYVNIRQIDTAMEMLVDSVLVLYID